MPRKISAANRVYLERLGRMDLNPRVATVTPHAGSNVQVAIRRVITSKPEYDKYVIAPGLRDQLMKDKECTPVGQIAVTTPGTKKTSVEIFAKLSENDGPVLLFLTHEIFRPNLTPQVGEAAEETMKRIVLFNKAVISLLMESGINPVVLHGAGGITSLALAYLRLDPTTLPVPPKTLFTLMDAQYGEFFPSSLRPLLGLGTGGQANDFYQRFLHYSGDTLSLARLGLIADLTVLGSKEHLDEVLSGKRAVGDWGRFPELLKQVNVAGKLTWLVHSTATLRSLSAINYANPSAAELDTLAYLRDRYYLAYSQLAGSIDLSRITEEALLRMIALNGTTIDFEVLAKLQRLLKHPFFSAKEITAIKNVCLNFGSSNLVTFLSSRLEIIDNPGEDNNTEKKQAANQIKTLLKQLKDYADQGFDWDHFKKIARNTFAAKPTSFEKVESITPYSLADNKADVIERGRNFLSSGQSNFSPLMVLTMSGGFGQRMQFSVALNPKTGTCLVPSRILDEETNLRLAGSGITPHNDSGLEDKVWPLTSEQVDRLLTSSPIPFTKKLANDIQEGLTKGELAVQLPKGIFVLAGQKYSLFEQQARALAKLGKASGKKIFWTIMTSQDNNGIVRQYFESNLKEGKYFGLIEPAQVKFIPQGAYPTVLKTKDSLDLHLSEQGDLYSAANGHGGFYLVAKAAIAEIEEEAGHKVEEVLACNIENVLLNHQLGNLDFIASWLGHKREKEQQVTGLATTKDRPTEQMGGFAKGDGVEQVIEYSHPSFSLIKAFAYEYEKGGKNGEVFFARDGEGRVLALDQQCFERLFNGPITEENWMKSVNYDKKTDKINEGIKLLKGYTPISLNDITEENTICLTKLVDDAITLDGAGFHKSDLKDRFGELKLKYRLGNTNVFMISTSLIDIVLNNPDVALKEEHKSGDTPFKDYKIERMIFGPFANMIPYEFRGQAVIDFPSGLFVGVVEAPRSACFEPLKTQADFAVARKALHALLKSRPELDLSNI